MTLKVKDRLVVGLTFIFTLFTYFVLADAFEIIAYNPLATVKLIIFHIVLFSLTFFANLYVLRCVFSSLKLLYLAIFTSILVVVLWNFGLTFLVRQFSPIQSDLYLYVKWGDYLRDVHGINWYFLDGVGWSLAELVYPAQILNFGLFFICKKLLIKNKKSKDLSVGK